MDRNDVVTVDLPGAVFLDSEFTEVGTNEYEWCPGREKRMIRTKEGHETEWLSLDCFEEQMDEIAADWKITGLFEY